MFTNVFIWLMPILLEWGYSRNRKDFQGLIKLIGGESVSCFDLSRGLAFFLGPPRIISLGPQQTLKSPPCSLCKYHHNNTYPLRVSVSSKQELVDLQLPYPSKLPHLLLLLYYYYYYQYQILLILQGHPLLLLLILLLLPILPIPNPPSTITRPSTTTITTTTSTIL